MGVPEPTERLRYREMTDDDLGDMAEMLGDPDVMRYYPRPKGWAEVQAWIDWNRRGYAEDGHGLWIVETLAGEFVGDCGLTWQTVGGRDALEVGYHVCSPMQRRGFATEAARASRGFASDVLGADHLVAIIHPDNLPSRRVAEKVGLVYEQDDDSGHGRRVVYGAAL